MEIVKPSSISSDTPSTPVERPVPNEVNVKSYKPSEAKRITSDAPQTYISENVMPSDEDARIPNQTDNLSNNYFEDKQSNFTSNVIPPTNITSESYQRALGPQESWTSLTDKELDVSKTTNLAGDNIISYSGDASNNSSTSSESTKKTECRETHLSTTLCIIYILFLIVVGTFCFAVDMFTAEYSIIAESFNLYLMVIQLGWLAFTIFNIRKYSYKEQINNKLKKTVGDTQDVVEDNVGPMAEMSDSQPYSFTSSIYGGSLYLKIGATVFCIGYLVITGLHLAEKVLFLLDEDPGIRGCSSGVDIAMSSLMLFSIAYQQFFCFKFSNVNINEWLITSKFGIIHCIGSSLCFWIYCIMQETLNSIVNMKVNVNNSNCNNIENDLTINNSLSPLPCDEVTKPQETLLGKKIYVGCKDTTNISGILQNVESYLFPFAIQFNIIMVGFWILFWKNLIAKEKQTLVQCSLSEVATNEENNMAPAPKAFIFIDFHASIRGLFAGLLLIVISIISIIIFFAFASHEETWIDGKRLIFVVQIVIIGLMFISSIIAFYKLQFLDILHSPVSSNHILLYVSLPWVFLHSILLSLPYVFLGKASYVVINILRMLQVILQTTLIDSGLSRCSNSKQLQHEKPGRETIIFLLMANIATWIVLSFQIRNVESEEIFFDFYGQEVWILLSHMSIPLVIFYRYHSSVCLVDIWKDAYEPQENNAREVENQRKM